MRGICLSSPDRLASRYPAALPVLGGVERGDLVAEALRGLGHRREGFGNGGRVAEGEEVIAAEVPDEGA